MANPNIVNTTSILGFTTMVSIGNTNTSNVIVSNAASSNKVLKINTILAANVDGVNNVDVTVKITNQAAGAGTSFAISNTITVPADSTFVVLGKDSPIYLEENRSIIALASAENDADIICSYEEIS
jgi:hypothetical protein